MAARLVLSARGRVPSPARAVLVDTEDRIQVARRFYNANVRSFDTLAQTFDFPFLVFAPFGAYALRRRRSMVRAVWLTAIAGSVISSLFYLSFDAGGGGDLQFGNARYWAPWYLWSVLAVAGITTIVTRIMTMPQPT